MSKGETISEWNVTYHRFNPSDEGLREVLCVLGNGYFATRGAWPESFASECHYPGTYMAGVYDRLGTPIAGRMIYNEDLVNCPNWLCLTFRIGNDDWILPSREKILSHKQELRIREGILSRRIRFRDKKGRVTVVEDMRIVSIDNPHLAAIRYVITPENYSDLITVRSMLDGSVENTGVARYRELVSKHLKPQSVGSFGKKGIFLSTRTIQSKIEIAQAAKTRILWRSAEVKPVSVVIRKDKDKVAQEMTIHVQKKKSYEVEKVVAVYTSRDRKFQGPLRLAVRSVKRAGWFHSLLDLHRRAWAALWEKADIRIQGDPFSENILRFHTFHLLQTASPHNTELDAGLPARGLHGESYRGHIFWDGLYTMPLYDFHFPEVSRSLLLYRYRRLGAARRYAKEDGYRGAMFPWQSGSSGAEETQIMHLNPKSGKWGPDASRIQRHVSFAIAYNVWQHWERTGDLEFLVKYGAEIVLSIAQFLSSLAVYEPNDRRYHTDGIMGPDEFHERMPGAKKYGLKDNAYSNAMIAWTIMKAKKIWGLLPKRHRNRLSKRLDLNEKEWNRWDDITRMMNVIIRSDGVISQFKGYFDLKELDWDAYRKKYEDIHRLDRILKAEGKSPDEYKVAKQGDVLMLFYLLPLSEIGELFGRLGYRFDKDMLARNYDYYSRRTSHGSTLSRVVHCYVAHLLGRAQEAWKWYLDILHSDIHDVQGGTTPEGIHAGVMGGSIFITMRAFAGICVLEDRIKIEPKLPPKWKGIRLHLTYHGAEISFVITHHTIQISTGGRKPRISRVPIEVGGEWYPIPIGNSIKIRYLD